MFTGLVEKIGRVTRLDLPGEHTDQRSGSNADCARLFVESDLCASAAIGDSVAINGCCLTVVATDSRGAAFDVVPESLKRTNLGKLSPGDAINLERSLKVGDRLGGHFVTGHIDGCGAIESIEPGEQWKMFWFSVPKLLTRQMASKGCVAVDGISLTLVEVTDDRFSIAVIPHTLAVTTLGQRREGDLCNIETDLIAKYLERGGQWNNEYADISAKA